MNLNLELLIKIMRYTTSTNDGEALTAVRLANEQLAKNGWDWEKLLRGKIAVAADPFAGVDFNAMMQGRRKSGIAPGTPGSPPPFYGTSPAAAPPPPYTPPPPPPPPTMRRGRRNSKPKINLSGLGISI